LINGQEQAFRYEGARGEENQNKYKTASTQTAGTLSFSEDEVSGIHGQLVLQDVTFINSKTQMEETRSRVRGVYAAWLGDTKHRLDCQLAIGCLNDRDLQNCVAAKYQAQYLRQHHLELVPPNNPNGTPPSDHTVATAFEILYYTKPGFDVRYLQDTFPHVY